MKLYQVLLHWWLKPLGGKKGNVNSHLLLCCAANFGECYIKFLGEGKKKW